MDEKERAWLDLIEGRRLDMSGAMWQAPTLTIAQAFLLQVLIDDERVGWKVGIPVALAGCAIVVAAVLSILIQHDRELTFSLEVARAAMAQGLPDPRRHALEVALGRRAREPSLMQRVKVWWLNQPLRRFWIGALLLFGIADLVALIVPRT